MNPSMEFLEQAAETWLIWVWYAGWQGALVGLALLVTVWVGRRWPAPLRYWILMLALVKFACPPLIPVSAGLFSRLAPNVFVQHGGTFARPVRTLAADALLATGLDPKDLGIAKDTDLENDVSNQQQIGTSPALLAGTFAVDVNWKVRLMLLHMLGSLAVLGWICAKVIALRRLEWTASEFPDRELNANFAMLCRQWECGRPVRLLASPAISSPVAFGILRPTIMVPTSSQKLDRQDWNTLLVHELAHLRRGDPWANWLQLLVCAVWWFHPVVWLVSRGLRAVREHCCDDLLLLSGIATQESYCATLLRVAAGPKASPVAVGMGHRLHPLASRLIRIMDKATPRSVGLSVGGVIIVIVLAVLLLPGLRPKRNEPTPQHITEEKKVVPDKVVAAPIEQPADVLRLSGALVLDPDRLARVHTRVPGEIVSVGTTDTAATADGKMPQRALRYGDAVKKGQVLAVVLSREVGEKKAELVDAVVNAKQQATLLERFRHVEPGIVAKSRLLEAERNAEAAKINIARAERTLRSWHVPDDEIRSIREDAEKFEPANPTGSPEIERRYSETQVIAPFDGVILEKNFTVGDVVDVSHDLFKIPDLSRLQVIVNVSEKDLPRLSELPAVERRWTIHFAASTKLKPVAGRFEVLGKIIEPNQHTATVIGWIDNADGALSAGQSIMAEISLKRDKDTVKRQVEGGDLNGNVAPPGASNGMVVAYQATGADIRTVIIGERSAPSLAPPGAAYFLEHGPITGSTPVNDPFLDSGPNYLDQFPEQVYGKPTSDLKANE